MCMAIFSRCLQIFKIQKILNWPVGLKLNCHTRIFTAIFYELYLILTTFILCSN